MATSRKRATKEDVEKQNQIYDIVSYSQKQLLEKKKEQLPRYIRKRKREFIKELEVYKIAQEQEDGQIQILNTKIPLYELSENCFAPVLKGIGLAPTYSPQEMDLMFDYFKDCIKELNKVTVFPPLKEQFCQLCGFSTEQFANYKNSSSPEMREIMLKVEDYICNYMHIGGLTGKLEKLNSIFVPKTLGRKEASDTQQVTNNNTLVLSDSEFIELLNQFPKK